MLPTLVALPLAAWAVVITISLAVAHPRDLAHPRAVPDSAAPSQPITRFRDDFERDLSGWEVEGTRGVSVRPSGDTTHGRVLVLTPHGDVHVLVKGSASWRGAKRIEGDVLFPTDIDSYLGVVYNFQRRGARADFGLIYLKGDDNYLQANPHRDYNVSRTFYPEYQVPLSGRAEVQIGRWQRFRVETSGDTCHFYVGDMDVPQMTFTLAGLSDGAVGLQPRSVGGDVWVDNVTVTSIPRLAYGGAPRPAVTYERDSLLATWSVAGPFDRTNDEIARRPAGTREWRPFTVDGRGGLPTGQVVDYHGPRTVAYFRSQLLSDFPTEAVLQLSTVDDLAVWVNGRFHWFVPAEASAWYDFASSPNHAGRRIPLDLVAGTNDLVIRVRGGRYASGGFFARVIRTGAKP
jgi:hypothetical protein